MDGNATVAQSDRATAFIWEPSGWKIEKIVKKGDYLYAVVRNHPERIRFDYVLYHRVVVENHLGRLLLPTEIVHHKNGDKKDNSIENLEIMDKCKHASLHRAEYGRLWVKLKCPICSSVFHRAKSFTFIQKPNKIGATCCSSVCRGKLSRIVQLNRITPEVERAISENILLEYRKFSRDNAEETMTMGSVETIRTSPETVKT